MEDCDYIGVETSQNGGLNFRYINSENPLQQIEGKCLWVFDISYNGGYDDASSGNWTPSGLVAAGVPLLLKIRYSNGKWYKVN